MNIKQTISHSIESKKIFICDFDDSFTYNLFSDFKKLGFDCEVINFRDTDLWKQLLLKKDKFLLVLGPGPGHPNHYDFGTFAPFLNLRNCFVFGVCLGHQIILSHLGAKIVESSNKLHGQTVDIIDSEHLFFSCDKIHTYQRYNSLTVDIGSLILKNAKYLFDSNMELMLFSADRVLSCQFHPESVGTNCPNSLYYIATHFLL